MKALDDVNQRCGTPTFGVGLTSNALPKEKQSYLGNCSQVGVFIYNVLNRSAKKILHWYVLRTTYGCGNKLVKCNC